MVGKSEHLVLSSTDSSHGGLEKNQSLRKDEDPLLVYLSSLSPGSRRTMRSSLDTVAGFLSDGSSNASSIDWSRLRYQHVAAVRSVVSEVYAPSTANKILSSVKGVMRECKRLGYISSDDYSEACDVPSVKGSRAKKGRALSRAELGDVLEACSSDENQERGLRDRAIISLMYSSGLRRSEVVGLDVGDLDPESPAITVRSGKGNMDRIIPVNRSSMSVTEKWNLLSRFSTGPLFRPISKSRKVSYKRMTDQGVLYVLQRRAREAGVASFTPHDLRRTFIGDLLEAGADISTVQQLAGHASVQTTTRYDRRGDEAKRRAASLLDLP